MFEAPAGINFREVPAPARLARYSAAIALEVKGRVGPPLCTSTLVVLYDPDLKETWGGDFRLVGQARVQVDEQMSSDPLLGEVLWATLSDQLEKETSGAALLLGTVTREISETFGGLELKSSALNAEVRCSWTPRFEGQTLGLNEHLTAWANYLVQVSAFPHENEYGFEVHDG